MAWAWRACPVTPEAWEKTRPGPRPTHDRLWRNRHQGVNSWPSPPPNTLMQPGSDPKYRPLQLEAVCGVERSRSRRRPSPCPPRS
eukprot:gene13521-biopygen8032